MLVDNSLKYMVYDVRFRNKDYQYFSVHVEAENMEDAKAKALVWYPEHHVTGTKELEDVAMVIA